MGDFYNSIKPLLLLVVFVVSAIRVIGHFTKKESKDMWYSFLQGAVAYFFVNGPAESLQAFGNLIRSAINYVSNMGG